MTSNVIAIDGPAGSGKSTVSRHVASTLGWIMLDTGAMYRAITWAVLQAGVDPAESKRVGDIARESVIELDTQADASSVYVNGIDVTSAIRSAEITSAVSTVSAAAEVRELLVEVQRETVRKSGHGIVVEGRDIGTVVLPDAQLKVFLTADPRTRAGRRSAELGQNSSEEELKRMQLKIEERDFKDSSREVSPLRAATDAVIIDTTDMKLDQVVQEICQLARKRYSLT
jgi:cytidylate kinase